MSASIDTRIVEMKFDNAQFEAGVRQTLASMQALEKGMKLDGAGKGLASASKGMNDITSAANKFSLAGLSAATEPVKASFSAMSAIALGAMASIGAKAVQYGTQAAKGLFDPIKSGLSEYETNLNAIQTILANTQASGASLKDVNGALNELNTYSDKTIYNFSEMAKNIGTFTAAGVDLKTATGSIKGIANLAALSGSNSQQASTAMYQLSQAISSGRVSLQDWNSVVNAGMGGTVFQRALAQTAENMGTLDKGAVKLTGKMKNATINGQSFRESITAKPGEKSWLTSDVLTKTLQQFTGDMSNAQLKAQGFSDAQIKAIQLQAKTAQDAATKVKTMSQLFGTLSETAGSGWATTWQLIFGDFEEAKTLWTNVNNVLSGFINMSSKARNKVLGDWKALGGRTDLIKSIANVFHFLMDVMKPIHDAFREIFPATTGKQLADLTKTILHFTEGLKMGGKTAENLQNTFAGVFAVFDIGWMVLKEIVKTFAHLFGVATSGSGSILDFTAKVGAWIVTVRDAIKNGEGLGQFFQRIGNILAIPIKVIKTLASAFFGLFSHIDTKKLDDLKSKFAPLGSLGDFVAQVWGRVADSLDNVMKFFGPMASRFYDFFSSFSSTIQDALGGVDFSSVTSALNTGLLAGAVLIFNKFVKNVGDGVDIMGGWKSHITGPFDALTGTLDQMQKTLRATTLLQIAAAVALLAGSAVALSKVDAAGLTRALTAMTVMFGQLAGAMALFQKINIGKGMGQLILMAAAIRILTSSVVALANLSWNDLVKGLTGVAVLLAGVALAAQLMPDGKKMISSSAGLVLMAAAIRILVSSVTELAGMSWADLTKGLVGVGVLLGSLALFTRLSAADKGGIIAGTGLVLMATGIKILASAVTDLSKLSWAEIAKGLVTLGGALLIITVAMNAMDGSLPGAAAFAIVTGAILLMVKGLQQLATMSWGDIAKGLVALAGALVLISAALWAMQGALPGAAAFAIAAYSIGLIANAMVIIGNMSWGAIAKGMVAMAGALAILAVAMYAMEAGLPGAAALIVAAQAIAILTPALVALGGLSWESILKGMVALAGALTILGIAGALLTPVIPTLMGLGISLALIGVGIGAAGLGVLAFSVGLTAIAASAGVATVAIVGLVTGLIGLIPVLAKGLGEGLVVMAVTIGQAAPVIVAALVKILLSLLNAVIALAPKIGSAALVLMNTMLRVLIAAVPAMANAGLRIITGILNAIASNVGRMVTAAASVIVNFLNGISANLPRIIQAGVNLIISFVNGIANAIRNNSAAMGAAGGNLATAIVEGMARGITGGLSVVTNAARNLAHSALDAAKNALGIHSPSREFAKLGKFSAEGYAQGLEGSSAQITATTKTMQDLLKNSMAAAKEDLATQEKRLQKLASARKKDRAAIRETTAAIKQARAELTKSTAAYNLSKTFGDETAKLKSLANQADSIAAKLKTANDNLAAAKKTRDDYNASVKDQYNNLPDISAETKLPDYITSLEKQIADTQIFSAQLQKLRAMGLDDSIYKDLLAKGTDAMPFVQQILEGGQASVNQLNTLDSALGKSATGLADTASKALYQAGVDAAAGLVKGLQQQEAAINKQMDRIADSMVAAIKKKLGIRSPSREFMKVGDWSAEGLAAGLQNSKAPVDAAEQVGSNAILAMQKTLTGLQDMVMGNVDVNPTITPVLDLTDVQKDADRLAGLLTTKPLEVGGAYSSARNLSNEVSAAQQARLDAADSGLPIGPSVTFIQNNNSPKALSDATIYRQTKNQLSVAKGALAKT